MNKQTDCHYCGESISHFDHQASCCDKCKHTWPPLASDAMAERDDHGEVKGLYF